MAAPREPPLSRFSRVVTTRPDIALDSPWQARHFSCRMATIVTGSAQIAEQLQSRIPAETVKLNRIETPFPVDGPRHLELIRPSSILHPFGASAGKGLASVAWTRMIPYGSARGRTRTAYNARMISVLALLFVAMSAADYAGPDVCAKCHPAEAESQARSAHARAIARAKPPQPGDWAFGAGNQAITFVTRLDAEHYLEEGRTWY